MMRNDWKKRTLVLAGAALFLTAGVSAGRAMAYFTTYTSASGGATLHLGFTTTVPGEEVSDWTKHVSIQNTGERECYVRARAFAGEVYEAAMTYTDDSGKWSKGDDGYYYYSEILAPGEASEELLIKIDHLDREEDFNVIVVQECTPVLYSEDGQPYADWSVLADTEEGEGAE